MEKKSLSTENNKGSGRGLKGRRQVRFACARREVMRMNRSTEVEESIEQMFAEVRAYLVEAEETLLPRLEAKVRDIRDICKQAYKVLDRLELRVAVQKRKK